MLTKRRLRVAMELAVERPSLLLQEANRLYHTRSFQRSFNPDGVDVVAADWDNLLVLDACRYDTFAARHDLPGELAPVESRAAHTSEFLLGNFHERDLTDTVYVTASPILRRGYPEKYRPEFHAVVDVWREDGWDDEHDTVLPETMVEYALEAAATYPRKRLVVHFIQPHYPFVGGDPGFDRGSRPDPEAGETDIWYAVARGELSVDREELLSAYRANLDVALPHVERLMAELAGKTVVTSDHGNMFGERSRPIPVRGWGHPPGLYVPELVTVPWLEHDDGTRREVVAEAPADETEAVDEAVVVDRLRQLGYAE